MQEMKLTYVNVGYGEAMLLECPDPSRRGGMFTMLVDGGGAEASEFADRSTGRIPCREWLQARGPDHIDLMVNTHPHEDHVSGMVPAAALLPPAELWQTLAPEFCLETMRPLDVSLARNPSQDKFLHALNDCLSLARTVREKGGTLRLVRAGMSGELCPGLRYTVLGPSAEKLRDLESRCAEIYAERDEEAFLKKLSSLDGMLNNLSVILALEYRGTRLLLPGDTNRAGYGEIDPAALKADLFKVGHHGQRDGADRRLLEAVRPKAVVCCASSDRRYNSADPQLLRMISELGAKLYFSDCPPVEGQTVPPHSALTFTVGENGALAAEYL